MFKNDFEKKKKYMENFPDDSIEIAIYRILEKDFTQEDLELAYVHGLIPMDQLEDGVWYQGHCRNASKAKWDVERKVFVYTRHKFNMTYDEDIVPPELDEGFDIFVAVKKLD